MVKIINQFNIDSRTKAGLDKKGKIHVRCLECNKDMIFVNFKRSKKSLKNIYVCASCKKQKIVDRHW